MGRIEKVIFLKNAVETLGYFSEQIALEMEHCGIDTYFVDYDHIVETLEYIPRFAVKGKTALITFNFIGLSEEDIFINENGRYIWEPYDVEYFNILVDHPLYYHSKLEKVSPQMTVYCIDKEHVSYVRRFYPTVKVRFLPLAGNVKADVNFSFLGSEQSSYGVKYRDYESIWNYEEELIPFEERSYDLVFTANYVPLQNLYRKLSAIDKEYEQFYNRILDELIEHPASSVDEVMERHIVEELGEVADHDKRAAMSGMLFIDLCARTYFRGEIIRELAEQDIKVHVFGADWNLLACEKPWNIVNNGGQISSAACVQAVRNAKISLNIMPWFKDGAHDRIFTAMLQKTVALTDNSKYLRNEFTDGEDITIFSLEKRQSLPEIIHTLLDDEKNARRIAENGFHKAYEHHTWRERAQELIKEFEK